MTNVQGVLKERDLISCNPETNILDAMKTLMDHKIGCLLVMGDKEELVGIVTDKDIFRAVYEHQSDFFNYKIKDFMTTNLIIGVPEDSLDYISGLMTKNDIRHVPIMGDHKLVGLLSSRDIVRAQMKAIKIENRYLKMYMDGTHLG